MRKRIESSNSILILKMFDRYAYIEVHQVAAEIGIAVANARRHLNTLHEAKQIYITGYLTGDRGPALPLYALGDKKDTPYPRKRSYKVKQAQYRERKRKLCLSTLWWISKPPEQKQVVVS